MKQEQQKQARSMFIQSDLSKTDIAEQLNVDRRTIYQWSIDGDWDKLKTSARNMPSILAEKCYYLIGHLTDHLLSKDSSYQSVTKADVDMIFKLAKTINILKRSSGTKFCASTTNENMETFTCFLEGLHKRDAALAESLLPHADTFINARVATDPSSFTLSGHDKQGFKPFNEKDIMEKWLDERDAESLLKEKEANANVGAQNFVPKNDVPQNSTPETSTIETQDSKPMDDTRPHLSFGEDGRGSKTKDWQTRLWEKHTKEKMRQERNGQRRAA